MNPHSHRTLISGERRGLAAASVRVGLSFASLFYGLGVRARNIAFARGWKKIERAAVPVISLGNVTAGGTGKTPFAAYIARWFRERGVRVCFLSRGYGATDGTVNDEALVLEQICPDVPHLQNPDRVASARVAVEELESQLLLLDDGFQHRRLARDLDIVLIDALNPWGYGRLLPRGLLREPLSGLRRADLVVITRVDQASPEELAQLKSRIAKIVAGGRGSCRAGGPRQTARQEPRPPENGSTPGLIEVSFPPTRLINVNGETAPLDSLRDQRVAAFCGIGHPPAFRQTLANCGFNVTTFREFADHHSYTPADVAELRSWSDTAKVAAVVTTQKDLVKFNEVRLGQTPLWAVEIGTHVISGNDALESALQRILQSIPV